MKILITESQLKKILNEVTEMSFDYNPGLGEKKVIRYVPASWYMNDNNFTSYIDEYYEGYKIGDLPYITKKMWYNWDNYVPPSKKGIESIFPYIVVHDESKGTNGFAIYEYREESKGGEVIKSYELVTKLLPEINIKSAPDFCEKTKYSNFGQNACLNWRSVLTPVGKYNDTSGVNRVDGCDNDKTPPWLYGCKKHPYGNTAYLHPEAAKSFQEMNTEFKNKYGRDIVIQSAYRDFFHQGGVDSGGNPKANAGTSNHGFGLSIDISTDSEEHKFIKNNGNDYGWCWFGKGDEVHFNFWPTLEKEGLTYTCEGIRYKRAKNRSEKIERGRKRNKDITRSW